MHLRLLTVLLVSLLCLQACTSNRVVEVVPGKLAPDFQLVDLDSKPVKLSDFRGKTVLLNFWATWCGPCVSEMPALERLSQQYQKEGLVVLGVAVDEQLSNLRAFRKQYSLTFPLVFDEHSEVKDMYGLSGVPESFLIDPQGRFMMFDDPDYNMASVRIVGPRHWDSATIAGRIAYLMQKAK